MYLFVKRFLNLLDLITTLTLIDAHALTVEHFDVQFASYNRVMLDARFLCSS